MNSQLMRDRLCWSRSTISYDVQTTGNLSVGLFPLRCFIIFVLNIASRWEAFPWYMMTGIEGVQWLNSSIQFDSVLRGATIR